jgi:alkylation response protein AidB-like acyl-CoA dehydrogenase
MVSMTEPHAGTEVANYHSRIVNDRIILNSSEARQAGMFPALTRIDEKPNREGISCILVQPNTPNSGITEAYHPMGQENLHKIQFNDRELPLKNVTIRKEDLGRL